MPDPPHSLTKMIGRGLRRRCPNCAGRKIFEGYWKLAPRCPTCGYGFERESGYWVGAIIINTAVTEVVFAILFVTVLFATIPDVRWAPLLLVGLGTNGLIPVFFYPFSKSIWMAVDLYFHPLRPGEHPGSVPR